MVTQMESKNITCVGGRGLGAEWETGNKLQYGGTSIAATEMKHKRLYTQKHMSEGYGGPHYACLFVYKYV